MAWHFCHTQKGRTRVKKKGSVPLTRKGWYGGSVQRHEDVSGDTWELGNFWTPNVDTPNKVNTPCNNPLVRVKGLVGVNVEACDPHDTYLSDWMANSGQNGIQRKDAFTQCFTQRDTTPPLTHYLATPSTTGHLGASVALERYRTDRATETTPNSFLFRSKISPCTGLAVATTRNHGYGSGLVTHHFALLWEGGTDPDNFQRTSWQ